MNIYTFKLTKKHIVAAILAAAVLIALLILLLPGRPAEETGATFTIKEPSDCREYLRQLGYETDGTTSETRTVQIPKAFDAVYENYNLMQKECGFDLQKYAGKKVELTTLHVTNWPDGEDVLADVLVYKKKVIGGAVYTASVDGFMQGLIPMNQSRQTS